MKIKHISLSWLPCGSSFLVELEFRELVLVEGEKPENPEKNPRSKATANNKLNPHKVPARNRNQGHIVGDDRSHHCAYSAPFFCASKTSKP